MCDPSWGPHAFYHFYNTFGEVRHFSCVLYLGTLSKERYRELWEGAELTSGAGPSGCSIHNAVSLWVYAECVFCMWLKEHQPVCKRAQVSSHGKGTQACIQRLQEPHRVWSEDQEHL